MKNEAIKQILRNPDNEYVIVCFTKANKEERIMKCTAIFDRIPEDKRPVSDPPPKATQEDETSCKVFDLEINEWRSFRYDSIKYITEHKPVITHRPNDPVKISRLEIIDASGRQYVNNSVQTLEYSLQDDGKTLKVFVNSRQ